MRISMIRQFDISNGLDVGAALFTQGCPFHCKGCFQPETWDYNSGQEYTNQTLNKILKIIEPEYIHRFSILGGEPLIPENIIELAQLVLEIKKKKPNIKIWVYTGYTIEALLKKINIDKNLENILKNIDVLVDGRFIEEEKDLSIDFRGSKNQRIIDIQKTLEKNNIAILHL